MRLQAVIEQSKIGSLRQPSFELSSSFRFVSSAIRRDLEVEQLSVGFIAPDGMLAPVLTWLPVDPGLHPRSILWSAGLTQMILKSRNVSCFFNERYFTSW
jgi:hypothetical protein